MVDNRNNNELSSETILVITSALGCDAHDIKDISMLKSGMTNVSYSFVVNNDRFIIRIPGEGTDLLIDRKQEASVFASISGKGLCDDPVFIDPDSGYKITRFLPDVRTCDPQNENDLILCMNRLKSFHDMRLSVDHTFDLHKHILYYESLWNKKQSSYPDYEKTKASVFALKDYIDKQDKDFVLSHIDSVPDNFLFYRGSDGNEQLQLTDWEYSGMQDPHVDIAMFCIYSMYDKKDCDRLIDIYFNYNCPPAVRIKIYCYIATAGLLWSNWCEYKGEFGIDFGEYNIRQYQYAKDFFGYVNELTGGIYG